ncbi:allophycocyanin subunit alpha-B [Fischerella thermalis]|uniref:allophycocyanin subunit alpha-B n=1 Tax=Fischerella thermalis TaxID=372787 RepID=UPI000C7FCE8E|nr:allophycocyanin subunit alpha-B [Fischerella thermalis]MBF1988140.1 allophycocyanin [Fischerella thermalis M58_A2018_009]MBF2061445.1 allophycocyanin [Fischerella thermalis M66_A2018_004]MBF2070718.1 allophycocyanin [Fischerella thermalis M48_A2018_028]PLZ86486.1 allophycocyanin [Fischerella thermalis CCMEE 5194]
MSIIIKSILNADREARYLNAGELSAIQEFYESGVSRLNLAMTLTENEQKIVEKASLKFWERCPNTPSNSGNRMYRNSCLRDQSWYIRLITYAVVVGDVEPLAAIGTIGVKEMYESLEIPLPNLVEAIRCLKEVSLDLFTLENATEIAPYFDYLIQSLMP